MSAILMMLLGLGGMAAGYFFYSRYIAERIYRFDPDFITPSHEYDDGIDYVPTNKFVLWGHHFTSVAGAAPIVGPAIAVIWGWLPAFLWVVFGTIFFAGVHDSGAIWASVRNRALSVGALTGHVVGKRARSIFMIVIFLVLLMVNAVFGVVIARLLIGNPGAVLPIWGAIAVALVIGQLIYRYKFNLPLVSLFGVVALYALIYIGPQVPISLPETVVGLSDGAAWILILFAYAAIASLLPVWVLLQPRDYINGLQLFVGLILLYSAVAISNPEIVAPMINHQLPEGTPSIVPLLFVTIACGAISGFHGLVASGTTSKQLNKETDARFVGYFGAVGEGALALAAVALVITATFMRQTGSGIQSSFYGVWLKQELGLDGATIGFLVGFGNAVSALAALTIGPLTRRYAIYWLLLVAVALAIIGVAITPALGGIFLLAMAIGIRGAGQGLNLPLMMTLTSRAVPPTLQGRVAALRITFNRFGSAIFPIMMGALAEVIGLEYAFYVIGASGVLLLCLLAIWVARSKEQFLT